MLNTWLTLRQIEEALQHDRLDEAARLVRQPEVAGHRKAGELRLRIGQALLARARMRQLSLIHI